MNRETRDKFATNTDETNCEWQTAPKIFKKIQTDFGPFDIDLTANADNHLLPKYFGPGSPLGEDALEVLWHEHGKRGFSNPPYGAFIPKILEWAVFMRDEYGFSSTFLLPLRINESFFENIMGVANEVWLCDKRLVFWENGKPRYSMNKRTGKMNTSPDTAMFDSMIVRYLPYYVHQTDFEKCGVPYHAT